MEDLGGKRLPLLLCVVQADGAPVNERGEQQLDAYGSAFAIGSFPEPGGLRRCGKGDALRPPAAGRRERAEREYEPEQRLAGRVHERCLRLLMSRETLCGLPVFRRSFKGGRMPARLTQLL